MKVAVMGAGAVGCYFGGMLARAGHDVVLIGRPQHVEAIEREGLRLQAQQFDEQIGHPHLTASTDPAAVAGAQLVLFCVKSTDTESAGASIKPHLAADALVLTLQNGVDNADRLRGVLGDEKVAATVVYVATEMAGPGHVLHRGRGELVIEPSASSASSASSLSSEAIAKMFVDAHVPVEISANVRGSLWAKLILNCAYNAISAIAQLPYGRLVKGEGVMDSIGDVVAECIAVAQADGVTLPPDIDGALRRIIESMPGQYSSTAQDVARGRRSEIDHLNGFVAQRGKALGVPTPANRMLHTLVRLIEDKAHNAV